MVVATVSQIITLNLVLGLVFIGRQRLGDSCRLTILRQFENAIHDHVFSKLNPTHKKAEKENSISEIHYDGGIITDGMLYYDTLTNLCVYVQYYNNDLISFDTNLIAMHAYHTIDTFYHFRGEIKNSATGRRLLTQILTAHTLLTKQAVKAMGICLFTPI